MADNQQWLDAGLRTLHQDGARGLTIERLMSEVGLSKGSFYHHFGGMAGYKTALLAHYEAADTTRFIAAAEQEPLATALTKLRRLVKMVCADDADWSLEVAVRAWAQQDAEVRSAQERIDRIRLEYLRAQWLELSGDIDHAERMADMVYLLLVGAGHVLPPVSPSRLGRLYEFLLDLTVAHRVPENYASAVSRSAIHRSASG